MDAPKTNVSCRSGWLFLVCIFCHGGGTPGIGLRLRLDQDDLTGLNVSQLFASFFLDRARIFPLKAVYLVLQALVYYFLLINLLLQPNRFSTLALIDLHAVGAADHLVTNENGEHSDA